MKEFVLAFPLSIPPEELWSWMIEKKLIAAAPTGPELFLKGVPFGFRAIPRPAHAELVSIFAEHSTIPSEEQQILEKHQGILFLLGNLKDADSFHTVQGAIRTLLEHGALGVAFEHAGSAYTAKEWLESDMDETMLGWLNWIETKGDLRTFGLECFGLSDLVVHCANDVDSDTLQVILLHIAEDMFLEGLPLQSGNIIEAGDGKSYMLRQEAKQPWPKGHPNFNAKGSIRLTVPQ